MSEAIARQNDPPSMPKTSACDAVWFNGMRLRSGIPDRHTETYRELYGRERNDPSAKVEQSIRERGNGYIVALVGIRGTGKTQIGVNLCLDRIVYTHGLGDRSPVLYVKASDIFRDIRQTFAKGSTSSELGVVAKYVKPSLLVIDEAQERGGTEFEDRCLTHIIDKRYDAILDTILISNLKRDEFGKAMGPSIVSRIHECGECIECNWPSFRGAKP